MSNVAPMTAAEYRAEQGILTTRGHRILAALEEREALLEQAKFGSADASVGELVRRIREHPKSVAPVVHDGYGLDVFTVPVSEDGFRALLSHLDSLLPKEPEVVTGPSGRSYRVKDGGVETRWSDGTSDYWMKLSPWSAVVAQDAPVVAKLLGGKDE